MAIPVVGDGEYLGFGNTGETLRVGKSTQAVTIGDSGASSVLIGGASAALVGFYGVTPVVRRTFVASLHNTTAIASSTDFTAAHLAVVNEIQNTLRGCGLWATA